MWMLRVSVPKTIDVLFPLVGWLIKGFNKPLQQQVKDDRWYTVFRPLYFYQKDIIGVNSYGPYFYGLVAINVVIIGGWNTN